MGVPHWTWPGVMGLYCVRCTLQHYPREMVLETLCQP